MELRSKTAPPSGSTRTATSVLRGLFVVGSIGVLTSVLLRGHFEARLYISDAGTFISDLPNAPVWLPPHVPAYNHFAGIFELPAEQPFSSSIAIVTRWDLMALDFLLWVWLMASLFSVLYLIVRDDCVDTFLHFVLHTAIGLTLGATACVGLWLVFGGWGPPAPLFFGICGLILGIIRGRGRLRLARSALTATPKNATEQSDPPKSPIGREFES